MTKEPKLLSSDSGINLSVADGMAIIKIDRQRRRNAVDTAAVRELARAMDHCAQDQSIRAIILTGEGTQAFCAGDDVKEIVKLNEAERAAHTRLGQELAQSMTTHPCVIIAAIEGYCLGGGLEFALGCDLRIASRTAVIGLPEIVNYNALPVWGGTHRLAEVVGLPKAREMILFGRLADGETALNWGLVSEVVPEGTSLDRATEIVQKLPEKTSRAALSTAKALMAKSALVDPKTADYMALLCEQNLASETSFAKVGN